MNAQELKAVQAPLKAAYREEPGKAVVTLRAEARALEGIVPAGDGASHRRGGPASRRRRRNASLFREYAAAGSRGLRGGNPERGRDLTGDPSSGCPSSRGRRSRLSRDSRRRQGCPGGFSSNPVALCHRLGRSDRQTSGTDRTLLCGPSNHPNFSGDQCGNESERGQLTALSRPPPMKHSTFLMPECSLFPAIRALSSNGNWGNRKKCRNKRRCSEQPILRDTMERD